MLGHLNIIVVSLNNADLSVDVSNGPKILMFNVNVDQVGHHIIWL